jgi:hypothetical protein
MKKQKTNWLIDAALFAGLLSCFWLDLTGVEFHQWLGIIVGAGALVHLLLHWDWVEAVTGRFFSRTSRQARTYYVIDAALLLGFWLILVSGLLISTWFNFSLGNISLWNNVHIAISIATLLLLTLKIGLHWRWIASVAQRYIFPPAAPQIKVPAETILKAQPAVVAVNTGRRDFLKLMGLVSAAALLSIAGIAQDALAGEASTQETSTSLSSQESLLQSSSSGSCVIRCNKSCSYPGRCQRYVDTNGNGRCDNGECA